MDLFNRNYLTYPEKIYKYWKDEKLCDLTLIAELDKTRVSVHRLVLSASTDFFDVLLTSEFKEHHRNEIVVKNISGTTLESVIHFFYTGIIEISSENAESLLAAASFLLSPQLQRKCTEYFERPGIIDASNCIGIWAVASKYAFQKMKAGASEVIYEQFMEVSKNEEFLRLNESYLVELLKNDKMNINSEEDVFNAIVDWVEFGVDERKLLFPKIVRAVRVNLLNEKFMIRHVFTVCKRFGCPSTFHELCDVSNDTNNDPIERVCFSPDLLAINFEKGDIKIEIFSQRLQTWRLLDNMVINKYWFGAELVGNHLFLIGGSSNEDTPVNTVDRINLVTQEHKDLQPMLQARWTPSILNTNGYIYVVGGVNRVYLNTAERYEIETNEWTSLASMSIGRTFVATAILSGKLYVMGGRSDNSTFLSSVECYDPTTNAWTHAAPMNSKRAGARGGVISGHLYVVGGLDGFNFLSTIERYDQQKNEWTMINIQLNNARCDFGMVLCQNLVIVAGGSVKDSDGKSCEQLSLLTGQLKYVQPMIAVKECCHLFRFKN